MLTLKDLEETGAIQTGHFRLSSGLHSAHYLQCARLLMWPERAEKAGRGLAEKLREFRPQVIASPALGGIIIGHETARGLGIPAIFAERVDGRFLIRRGFSIEPGERVAIVEDVWTTGGSSLEVAAAVGAAGGKVVALAALVDRGVSSGAFPAPSLCLLTLRLPSWPESECLLCRDRVPIESPGSRFARRNA